MEFNFSAISEIHKDPRCYKLTGMGCLVIADSALAGLLLKRHALIQND